ncbi:MAG: hypothetical protein EA377_04310 [Phycisphaerales bacterium]|nr:MAG: hypothetical protein EA377_04310 [Phycisphaerales bacterium]
MRWIVLLIALGFLLPTNHALADDWPRVAEGQLDNGIRYVIVHIPDAKRQSFSTFLPLHLANDGKDRSQWSHLLERHLLRSTDPRTLRPDSNLHMNGETGESALRLDASAPHPDWRRAFDRHATWLRTCEFERSMHKQELRSIRHEEEVLIAGRSTHRAALAAWNQIVRHRANHGATRADVHQSDLEQLMAYGSEHLPIGGEVMIASVGPVDPDAIIERLESEIGTIEIVNWREPDARPLQPDAVGHFRGTWDLPVEHMFIWWHLPNGSVDTGLASLALGRMLQMNLQNHPELAERVAQVHAFRPVPTAEAHYLLITIALSDVGVPESVRPLLEQVVENVLRDQTLRKEAPLSVAMIRQEMGSMWQIRQMRQARQVQLRDFAEINAMQPRWSLAYATGASFERTSRAVQRMDVDDVLILGRALRESPMGMLTLTVREERTRAAE